MILNQHEASSTWLYGDARNWRYDNQSNPQTLNFAKFVYKFTLPGNLRKSPKSFVSLTKATSTDDDTNK